MYETEYRCLYRQGDIPNEMQQYLVPRYSEPGKLKKNPKLHKTRAPLCAIISGLNTTERCGAEFELNEFVEASPSYLRDTTDFIQKLRGIPEPLPANSILFCFDVQKLNPSIHKKEGPDACREALDGRTKPLLTPPTRCQLLFQRCWITRTSVSEIAITYIRMESRLVPGWERILRVATCVNGMSS